jgi:ABC-2 type transport system permease protein
MIIGRFVKEEETADMAGGAISFPMMFLAGTFFPLDQMPVFLQEFARILPLYYVNEGLRNAMIYMNFDKAFFNTVIVMIFAVVFFIAGVALTKWKED